MGLRRFFGTSAQRAASSATGSAGDLFYESDTNALGVADGTTLLGSLKRFLRSGEALRVASPETFGAVGDVQVQRATVGITSGGSRLTWPTSIFTAADVGKRLVLTQAGTASTTGSISAVPVSTAGTGYTSVPTASASGSGSNAALFPRMKVVSATVNAGGSGYLSGGSGTVTLTLNTGYGTQAQLACTVTSGVVTAVSSVAVGGQYTVLPTLAASPHAFNTAGSGATFNLAIGVDSIVVGNVGSGYALSGTTASLTGGGAGTPGTLGAPTVLPTLPALATTITGYVSGTQVDLAATFGNSGSAFRLLAWGTDDTTAITNAMASLTKGGVLALTHGKSYGHTAHIALPDDGRCVSIVGGGVEATRLVALASMTEQIYKGTISGVAAVEGFTVEGCTLPTHNENLYGSHRTLHRNMLYRNAAQGGSNVIWGDPTFTGQSYENAADLTVRIENLEGYSTAYDCPAYNLENYGTDNRAEVVYVGAYQACVLNSSGDLQVGRGHGFGSTTGLTPQFIIWDKGQMSTAGFTCDNWAQGGAGIYRDFNFQASGSQFVGTTFVYITQPVAGTNCVRIASGADVVVHASSFAKGNGFEAFQAVDKIVQVGTISPRSVLTGNPGALLSTGPALTPGTPTTITAAGSFGLNVHDGSVSGGNGLGAGAVDLSVIRNTASAVASGTAAFNAGQSNTASGNNSATIGINCTTTAAQSSARGTNGSDNGTLKRDVWGGGIFAAQGDNQAARTIYWASTASTAATRLSTNGAGTASSTVGALLANSSQVLRGVFHGRNPSTGNAVAWQLSPIVITKAGTIVSTALDGTPSWTLITSSAHGVSTPVLAVDTTYGAPGFTITAPDTTAWHWQMVLDTSEIG